MDFPAPLTPTKRDALAALDHEIHVGENLVLGGAGTVALGYVRELGYYAAAWLGLREGEVNRLFFFRDFDALDLLQLLDAALDLLGLGGRIAKAVDEDFQLLDAVALRFVGGFELLFAGGFRGQILIVVAGVHMQLLVPDLDDAVDGDVEEIAVVRDEDKGVGIAAQILFQPVAGFEIEMVGGLVEQEQIRLLQQQLGERDAHLPAAGKFFRLARPVVSVET